MAEAGRDATKLERSVTVIVGTEVEGVTAPAPDGYPLYARDPKQTPVVLRPLGSEELSAHVEAFPTTPSLIPLAVIKGGMNTGLLPSRWASRYACWRTVVWS